MSILDAPIGRLDGTPSSLREITGGTTALLVNVASKCGLTPQYAALEQLQEKFGHRGFTVVGLPCNQFLGQEPGSAEEIAEFCSATYGITFPMTEKIDVNGEDRHEIYRGLLGTPDRDGRTGDVQWNFEKFLLSDSGEVIARYAPGVLPDDPQVVATIETNL